MFKFMLFPLNNGNKGAQEIKYIFKSLLNAKIHLQYTLNSSQH